LAEHGTVEADRPGLLLAIRDRSGPQIKVSIQMQVIPRMLVLIGNTLTLIGCLGLALGATGVIDLTLFAIGISSGIRTVGSVAIAGCLCSAIGYGILEFQER